MEESDDEIIHLYMDSDYIVFRLSLICDRNHYSYIWHDIGRAILSFALRDNRIDIDKTYLFSEDRGKIVRFKNEMLWLTEYWFELDSLLCP